MNYRKSILLMELQKKIKIDVGAFMDEFQISQRTLKNDVNELNRELGHDFIHLLQGTVEVYETDKFNSVSLDLMKKTDLYSYRMSRDERMILESMLILFSRSYVTAGSLCMHLLVSRGTILSDLNLLRSRLQKEGMKLTAKTNHGFRIRGEEANIRKYIEHHIVEKHDHESPFYVSQMEHLLTEGMNLDYISRQLIKEMDHAGSLLSDDSYRQILNYLMISFKRIQAGHILKNKKNAPYSDLKHRAFLERCGSDFMDVENITDEEVYRFQVKLKHILDDHSSTSADADENMKISSFVWEVCQSLDIIQEFGYENYKALFQHLTSTIYYLKSNRKIPDNPFCEEIKTTYPYVFQCITENVHIIQELVEKRFNENDISYIAMHIASVMEGNKNNDEPLHAVIVCPKGRCVSILLQARILKYFNIIIDDIVPAYMVNSILDTDFIISTIPLEQVECPIIVVNQMFLQSDVDKMQEFLQKIYKLIRERQVIGEIEDYVQEYQLIALQNDHMDHRLQELNARYMQEEQDKDNRQFFYRMLKPDHILLNFETKNWVEATRKSGELLLKSDYLSNQYIDKMVSLVKENGPYIVFQPGFVIAHAGPEDGANRLGISLVRLKEKLQFETSEIPVKFIICMSIPDKQSHVFLMFQMYKCLINKKLFDFLSETDSIEEFLSIIKIFELNMETD